MITKTTLLTRIRQMSDTVSATVDYPTTLIADLASTVFLDEWKQILGANPYYQIARRTVTLDANGRTPLSGLSATNQNLFRILQVQDASRRDYVYSAPSQIDMLTDLTSITRGYRMWTRVGSEIQAIGARNGDTLTFLVNWTPPTPNEIDSDSGVIEFLPNYEPILYYETAALVLAKAGREMSEAAGLRSVAEALRERMLSDIRRDAGEPTMFQATDSTWEWGG